MILIYKIVKVTQEAYSYILGMIDAMNSICIKPDGHLTWKLIIGNLFLVGYDFCILGWDLNFDEYVNWDIVCPV